MCKLEPIILSNGVIEIHPLRKTDLIRHNDFVDDLFEIFGDIESIPFNMERFAKNKEIISSQMLGVSLGYDQQSSYTHFLTLIKLNKIIGEIIILSPRTVTPSYGIEDTWLIEYFLNKKLWNNGLMSGAVKAVVSNLQGQGIKNIGALVIRENIPSIRVLEKTGFKRLRQFDLKQDFYKI